MFCLPRCPQGLDDGGRSVHIYRVEIVQTVTAPMGVRWPHVLFPKEPGAVAWYRGDGSTVKENARP